MASLVDGLLTTRGELPELDVIRDLLRRLSLHGRVQRLALVAHGDRSLPIDGLVLGADRPAPTLVIVAGVHGIERVGTHVALAWLATLAELLDWDRTLHDQLGRVRVVAVPLVNPVGMAARRRGNAGGVDLMRNAPVHPDAVGSPLVGGHRLGAWLPWYMGKAGAPMETEAAALLGFVERETFGCDPVIVVDLHSGFGTIDRLWFPWARTRRPFPRIAEVHGMHRLLDRTLPNHVYRVEPIARVYTVQGDLWDHLWDRHATAHPDHVLLPLTLEMGSWSWVRKNPRQLASVLGGFNPMRDHRLRRVMRRHLPLFDFLLRAAASPSAWIPRGEKDRRRCEAEAFAAYWG